MCKRWWMLALLALVVVSRHGLAQNGPQVLPYTINPVAGGGTVCATAADAEGDGCPALQATLNAELLGVALDGENNLYILDTENNLLRRVDAKTGIITVAAGSASTTVCTGALDRYGDGCLATDGLANVGGKHTSLGKPYAIAIAKNGDIFISAGISLVQKISAATGIMTVAAGSTSPAGSTGAAVTGYTGDKGPATSATLNAPRGVAVDASEDLYIADTTNNVLRVVYNGGAAAAAQITAANPGVTAPVIGDIYTIAGSTAGTAGTTGNNGPAGASLLTGPSDVGVDQYGNVFIADQSKVVRMIYAGGNVMGIASPVVGDIYQVAGGGSVHGNTLNDVLGTTVGLSVLRRIIVDHRGNLYIADENQIIWFEDGTTGWMRPIAGVYKGSTLPTGCTQQTDAYGDNCPATVATIGLGTSNTGYGMAADSSGNLYIGDASAMTVRKVSSNLSFPSTAKGSTATQTVELHYAPGTAPATTAPFVFANTDYSAAAPSCITNGDTTQDCTVAITYTPSVPGVDRGTLTTANNPMSLGTFGLMATGVAPALSIDPGTATSLGNGLNLPQTIAQDGNGNLFIADTANNRILRYTIASQTQTVIAGTGTAGYTGDGAAATAATLRSPRGVVIASDGTIYIADSGNNVVRRVDPVTAVITTFAGGASTVCATSTNALGDGCPGPQAIFSAPAGVALDANGLLYVADTGNNRIRAVPLSSYGVLTVVGGGTVCTGATDTVGDGCNALQATLSGPTQMRFDVSGNLYISDSGNNRVRRVNLPASGQTIVSVAGTGVAGGSGDGGLATAAQVNSPAGLAFDGGGSLYIADVNNHAVRMVDSASGVITTVAGYNGTSGAGTLPGPATTTQLDLPRGVEVVGSGTLYVLDTGNSRGLAINRDTLTFNFGKVNPGSSSAVQQFTITGTGNSAAALGSPLTTATGTPSQFTFVPATTSGCSASQPLTGGQQCAMSGQFKPTLTGNQSATYTFTGSTGINSPTPSVNLLGGGFPLIATSSVTVLTTPATGNPQYGAPAAVTVTITPASQGTATITGSVTFQIDTGALQAPIAITANAAGNGVATFNLPTTLSVGSHMVYATYSGDLNYASSTATPLTVVVIQTATTTSVSALPTSVIQFQSVTFTASVTSSTGAVPSGAVNFFNGTTPLGAGTLNAQGQATFTSATLAVGTYQIIAQYVGGGNFAASTSATLTFVVSPDPPDFTLTSTITGLSVAQGGVAQATFTMTPTNTLVGNVTMSCSGLPVDTYCTFQPQILSYTLATDQPQSVLVTFWTNIPPGTVPGQASVAPQSQRVWFALLAPLGLLLVRRKRWTKLLALGCLLVSFSTVFSGCSTNAAPLVVTPAGTTNIVVQGTGPNGQVHAVPITLTVVAKP